MQDAGLKLMSVASEVWSKSSRAMIESLIAGQRDPAAPARMSKGVMRRKIDRLEEALTGHFRPHHAIVARQIIDHIDHLDRAINSLNNAIAEQIAPHEPAITLLTSMVGVARKSAKVIIAETGADMTRFPAAGHLCAWAGVCPASHESAGKARPAGTRPGSRWLKSTLIECAKSASRTKGTYYRAQYRRIASRRGPNKAAMAVANSILATAWHLLTNGTFYQDPGADYLQRRHDPQDEAKRLTRKIVALGVDVALTARIPS